MMSAKVLEQLKSEEFAVSVGFLSTAGALRRFLSRTSEVVAVRQALREGAITETTIRGFVSVLVQDLRIGERLPHELALAALAVALETCHADFAEELLGDLSGLKLAELSTCIRVARECRRHRASIPCRSARVLNLKSPDEEMPFLVQTLEAKCQGNGSQAENTLCVCEVT